MKKIKNKGLIKILTICETIALIASIGGGLMTGFLSKTASEYVANYEDEISFVEANDCDLKISGPSEAQILSFKNNENVDLAIPGTSVNIPAKINGTKEKSSLLMYENEEGIKHSSFTDSRIIDSCETTGKSVYIDYRYAKNHNLKVNDKLSLFIQGNEINAVVSRVYRTNYDFEKGVIVINKEVFPNDMDYNFINLKASNLNALKESLKDYKPLGELLPKTQYQTEEQYQEYLDIFNGKDYYTSHVVSINGDGQEVEAFYKGKINSSKNNLLIATICFSVSTLLISLGCFFVNAKNKEDKIQRFVKDNGNSKVFKTYLIFNVSFMLFLALANIIATIIVPSMLTSYFTVGTTFGINTLAICLPVLGVLISTIITSIFIKRI